MLQVYGPESSGKTTLALHAMAEVQKSGGTAALIDAEHAFDPEYSKVSPVSVVTCPCGKSTIQHDWLKLQLGTIVSGSPSAIFSVPVELHLSSRRPRFFLQTSA